MIVQPVTPIEEIGNNERGCRPIFHVEITAHWKERYNSKAFLGAVTLKMVYKGPAKKQNTKTWLDDVKKDFFKVMFKKGKDISDVTLATFEVVRFVPLAHLGYEVQPGLE